MTEIHHEDDVIYRIAMNEHPMHVGEDDDRTDEELVEEMDSRTETAGDLDFPGWMIAVSDPPDMETLRYPIFKTRINVLAPYDMSHHKHEYDVFDAVAERIEIEGFDVENAAMSSFPVEHPDDFDGDVHLDLTD